MHIILNAVCILLTLFMILVIIGHVQWIILNNRLEALIDKDFKDEKESRYNS